MSLGSINLIFQVQVLCPPSGCTERGVKGLLKEALGLPLERKSVELAGEGKDLMSYHSTEWERGEREWGRRGSQKKLT